MRNYLIYLPPSSVGFSSSSSSSLATSTPSIPIIATATWSFLISSWKLRSEVTGDAAVWLRVRITGRRETEDVWTGRAQEVYINQRKERKLFHTCVCAFGCRDPGAGCVKAMVSGRRNRMYWKMDSFEKKRYSCSYPICVPNLSLLKLQPLYFHHG